MTQDFDWTAAKTAADSAIFDSTKSHLSDIEIKVLDGSWQGKTYEQMAALYGYSAAYLNQDIGNKLWKKLSDALQEKVTKKNFREALNRSLNGPSQPSPTTDSKSLLTGMGLSYPSGVVPLDSPFYLERSHIEPICYQAVLEPGALIRIKAPRLMGKTSLMTRTLAAAAAHGYRTVYLDLRSCNRAIFPDSEGFLRWMCAKVAHQLSLDNQLNSYWNTDILGSNDNCTAYFEEYLFPNIEQPIVLGIDDSDLLFSHTALAEDVLGLLRSWHEKGKTSSIWQQLRLVIAHSTEVYIPLDINQSPFNVGLPVELPEFDREAVKTLAERYHVTLAPHQLDTLMQMVGGHPYLIQLALYKLCTSNTTLEELLTHAPTHSGIYSDHLRGHLETLDHSPALIPAVQQVVTTQGPVALDPKQTYQLHNMGLVKQLDNHVVSRCHLYRAYFCHALN